MVGGSIEVVLGGVDHDGVTKRLVWSLHIALKVFLKVQLSTPTEELL